ncbi:2625_t:CDS:2, partial [Acaulospora colombiana]
VKWKGKPKEEKGTSENATDNEVRQTKGANQSSKVRAGDIVTIRSPDLDLERKRIRSTKRDAESFSQEEIARIRSMIIYQDDEIMVINKPTRLATQGGPKTLEHVDGLLRALQYDYPDPPRLVHRLDKNTTGALILGRTRSAAGQLSSMFRESSIEKM